MKDKKQKRKFRIPFIYDIIHNRRKRLALTALFSLLFFLWFYNSYLAITIVQIGENNNIQNLISVVPPKTIPANLTYYNYILSTNVTLTQPAQYYQEFNIIFGDFGFWIPYSLLFGLTLFFFLLLRHFQISSDLILIFLASFNLALIILTLAYFINPIWTIIGITLSLIYITYRIIQERKEELS